MRRALANLRADAVMIGRTSCQLFGLVLFCAGTCVTVAIFF